VNVAVAAVSSTNHAPVAVVGPDQTVSGGASVTLDGSGSSDPDGDAITYKWTQTAGTAVTLSSTTAQKPTFTAPNPTAATTLAFSLVVTDSKGLASAAATAHVGVQPVVSGGIGSTTGNFQKEPSLHALTRHSVVVFFMTSTAVIGTVDYGVGGYTAQATVNTILIELLRKRGLKPDEYKILNVGTARLPALLSGNVPAAVLNGLETAKAVKQGFRPLARAADEIELATGGLGASVASIQSNREVFRAVVQAVLESIRISATQKERVLPVLMKQFSIPYDDASLILDIVQKGWALDGRPTPGSQKFRLRPRAARDGIKRAAEAGAGL